MLGSACVDIRQSPMTDVYLLACFIFRPHRLYAVHKMRPIATDVARSVVCLCVCVLGIRVSCEITAQPIKMPLEGLIQVGRRNHISDGDQDRTNPFAAARGDKTAMRPFCKINLDTCFNICTVLSFACLSFSSALLRVLRDLLYDKK